MQLSASFSPQKSSSVSCCEQIVNLVSNDVRRFDDAMPFWPFLYAGPLELAIILVLLSFQLGAPAAFAGVATMLLVIPTQVPPSPPGYDTKEDRLAGSLQKSF